MPNISFAAFRQYRKVPADNAGNLLFRHGVTILRLKGQFTAQLLALHQGIQHGISGHVLCGGQRCDTLTQVIREKDASSGGNR